jgi:anti-sigma factor RsiW
MKCEHTGSLLHLFADGELGAVRRWRLDRHVAACDACAGQLSSLQSLRAGLRASLPYHRAPPALAARIGATLAREAAPPVPERRRRSARLPVLGTGFAGALAGVALTLLVTGGTPLTPSSGADSDLIASHIRSMMGEHLTDVRTSDRHTVKPWLSARLDVSPPVRDLASDGFPLVGGRLDYINGHPAAVVIYRRREHVMNLFAWSSSGADQPMRVSSRQGFNVVAWKQGGTDFAAVSDVDATELKDFATRIEAGR